MDLAETQSRDLSLLLSFKIDKIAPVRWWRGRKQDARSCIKVLALLCWGSKVTGSRREGLMLFFFLLEIQLGGDMQRARVRSFVLQVATSLTCTMNGR